MAGAWYWPLAEVKLSTQVPWVSSTWPLYVAWASHGLVAGFKEGTFPVREGL